MSDRPSILARLRGNAGIAWPPLTRGRAAELVALLHLLDETQWMTAEELAKRQSRQLALLLPHLARQSKQFQRRLEDAGLRPDDLATKEELPRLPVLRRRGLQVSPQDLYCKDVPQSHLPLGESRTSGSTGEPVAIRRTLVSQLFWRALNIRSQSWQGQDFAKHCTIIRPQVTSYAINKDRGAPLNQLFDTGPSQAIPMTTDIKQQVEWISEFKPESLIVYPTNLDAITQHCGRHDIKLPGLEKILTIGETLLPRVRQAAEATLGAIVADKYSSQEAGVIAAQCLESGLYHLMSESLIVEVLKDDGSPCAEGEIGRVIITDLVNFATPIVRYDIGDYAEVGPPCTCGRGLPTLKQILGRERNLLVKPDGTRHWPLVGFARFRDIAPIRQYQFIQHDLERIEVRLVAEQALTAAQEADLAAVIRQALGFPFALQFTSFDHEIPRSPGGKFEEFLSLVPAAGLAPAN